MLMNHLTKDLAIPQKKAKLVVDTTANNDKIVLKDFRDWAEILLKADFAKDSFNMH